MDSGGLFLLLQIILQPVGQEEYAPFKADRFNMLCC